MHFMKTSDTVGRDHFFKIMGLSPAVTNSLCPWARHFTSIAPLHPSDIWGTVKGILQSSVDRIVAVEMAACPSDAT